MRLAAALLILPLPAVAQEIVVTGRGLEAPPGEAAYAVAEIGRERLTQTASGRFEDVLRDAAGVAQFRRADSRSSHPTAQGITLRGLGGNASSRALLLLDGVPQADPFGGWVPFPAYLPERLGSVRITRGGGSGYHGAGALAGTVELFSAGPELLGPLAVTGFYGSRESVDLVATSGVRLGGGALTLAGQYALKSLHYCFEKRVGPVAAAFLQSIARHRDLAAQVQVSDLYAAPWPVRRSHVATLKHDKQPYHTGECP